MKKLIAILALATSFAAFAEEAKATTTETKKTEKKVEKKADKKADAAKIDPAPATPAADKK